LIIHNLTRKRWQLEALRLIVAPLLLHAARARYNRGLFPLLVSRWCALPAQVGPADILE